MNRGNWVIKTYNKIVWHFSYSFWNLKMHEEYKETVHLRLVNSFQYLGLILGYKYFNYDSIDIKEVNYLLYTEMSKINNVFFPHCSNRFIKESFSESVMRGQLHRYDIILPIIKLKFYEENINFNLCDIQKISIKVAEMLQDIEKAIMNNTINEFIDSI